MCAAQILSKFQPLSSGIMRNFNLAQSDSNFKNHKKDFSDALIAAFLTFHLEDMKGSVQNQNLAIKCVRGVLLEWMKANGGPDFEVIV